jgi:hypothetical protein
MLSLDKILNITDDMYSFYFYDVLHYVFHQPEVRVENNTLYITYIHNSYTYNVELPLNTKPLYRMNMDLILHNVVHNPKLPIFIHPIIQKPIEYNIEYGSSSRNILLRYIDRLFDNNTIAVDEMTIDEDKYHLLNFSLKGERTQILIPKGMKYIRDDPIYINTLPVLRSFDNDSGDDDLIS